MYNMIVDASFSSQFRIKVAQHYIESFLYNWNWRPFVPKEIVTTRGHRGDGIDLDRRTNEAKKRRSVLAAAPVQGGLSPGEPGLG